MAAPANQSASIRSSVSTSNSNGMQRWPCLSAGIPEEERLGKREDKGTRDSAVSYF